MNPNSLTCPIFLQRRDANITKTAYNCFPVLKRDQQVSAWGAQLYRLFDMTLDNEVLYTGTDLAAEGWCREDRNYRRGAAVMVPIIEGKMVTFYDHRAAHIRLNPDAPSRQQQTEDCTDLEKAAAGGNRDAALAIDVFAYQVKKTIGAYAAAMGGVDAVSFTGGIGENSARLRAVCCEGLGFLGISVDPHRNEEGTGDRIVSADDSRAAVLALATNEELVVARRAYAKLQQRAATA
jgi:hypothetical protein